MFVFYLRKFSLIKYIRHKNVQMEHEEPFYKKLHVYMFLKEDIDFLATLWLGALHTFEIRLDEYILNL